MKKIDLKVFIIYFLIIVYTVLSSMFLIKQYRNVYLYYINPIIWLLIFLITLFVSKDEDRRIKGKIDKIQVIFITVILYLMIYFAMGLFFGYQKSPYTHTFIGYLNNFSAIFIIVIFKEFIRSFLLMNSERNKVLYFFITLLFIIIEINFTNLVDSFSSSAEIFKYFSSVLFPLILKNILITYLMLTCGLSGVLSYLLPISFANIVLPIFPMLNWFLSTILEILLMLILYIYVSSIHAKKTLKTSHRRLKKQSPFKMLPFVFIIVILVLFIAGFFKYMPVAVMSNSMKGTYERGDVVIISKIDDEEIKNLKIGDIIEYAYDKTYVMHRIIRIDKDINGNLLFTTKGDNNKSEDKRKVTEKQVLGIIKYKIPKIGYPSVLINEIFKKIKPNVEI